MPLVENETVHILRLLQQRLKDEGNLVQGEMMGRVADKIAAAQNIDHALEQLYAVHGWDAIALRLMWYVERARAKGNEPPHDSLIDYQVDELRQLLLNPPPEDAPSAPPESPEEETPQSSVSGLLFEAVHEFSTTLEDLRRSAFEGERVPGMREGLFDAALSHAGRLHQVSSSQGVEPLARFAEASSLFLRYVVEHALFDDVRVAHLLDNACQALEGVIEHPGSEDYDGLLQCIDMLQNPETLLE